MKKFIIITITLYFSFGFVFALYVYSRDLRIFKCDDANAPHLYTTIGTGLFKNPDPERCIRRGLELNSIANIPFLTVFGIPILIARSISGNN